MNKLITIVALASALTLVGCKKKADDKAAPKVEDKGTVPAPATGSAPATAAATGSEPGTGAPAGPGDTISTGSPECDAYLKAFDDIVVKCKEKMGPALDAMKQSRDAQAESFKSWGTLDEASKKATIEAAATGCKSATDALKQSATAMGCTL